MFVIVRERRECRNENGEDVRELGSAVVSGVVATVVAAAVAVEVRVLVAADVIELKGDGDFETKDTVRKTVPVTVKL